VYLMVIMQGSLDYLVSMIIFILFILFLNELQALMLRYSLRSFINEITIYEKLSKRLFVGLILKYRKDIVKDLTDENPDAIAKRIMALDEFKKMMERIDEIINSFLIYPVTLDPTGIIERLEHLIDVRRRRLEGISLKILPEAPSFVNKNLESALEAAAVIRYLWKISVHLYKVGIRTNNIFYLFQLKFWVPFFRELCLSFYDAIKSFVVGAPVGDSVGAMVAQKFFGEVVDVDEEMRIAYSSIEYNGRYILAVKAVGPGSEVGRPGRFLEKILQKIEGNVDAVITVDAALRLESEEPGHVDVGVGAAIGDPGPEKFRIEKWTAKYKIPLFAVAIKENYLESLTPLRKELLSSVDEAYKIIRRLIVEEVPEGGKVIILGIGNTVGISDKPVR